MDQDARGNECDGLTPEDFKYRNSDLVSYPHYDLVPLPTNILEQTTERQIVQGLVQGRSMDGTIESSLQNLDIGVPQKCDASAAIDAANERAGKTRLMMGQC